MAKMSADSTALIKQLNALIALDFDGIEGSEAAIARLNEVNDKAQPTRFLGDHRRHVVDLAPLVRELGGEPTTKAERTGGLRCAGSAANRATNLIGHRCA